MSRLLRSEWEQELTRSGLQFVTPADAGVTDGVTCPACGTTAPLESGACSDCGLVLG
ncbi:MAG: hypothetical protein GY762_03800 [Proteobacteria bacterium]|nr:hypothetical protein [Pseudomonadota bacterium]